MPPPEAALARRSPGGSGKGNSQWGAAIPNGGRCHSFRLPATPFPAYIYIYYFLYICFCFVPWGAPAPQTPQTPRGGVGGGSPPTGGGLGRWLPGDPRDDPRWTTGDRPNPLGATVPSVEAFLASSRRLVKNTNRNASTDATVAPRRFLRRHGGP